VQELSVEVKDLRSQNERLRYHRERSQGDMKDIQGTIVETKDVIAGVTTSVETVLNDLGVPKAVHEDGRPEDVNELHGDSVQPLLCVSHSSVCAYMLMWTIFAAAIALLLTASEMGLQIQNRLLTAQRSLRMVVTLANEPTSRNTMWSVIRSCFLGLRLA
jgi:hypothetical protein